MRKSELCAVLDLDLLDVEAAVIPFSGLSGAAGRPMPQNGIRALMQAVLAEGIRSYLGPRGRLQAEAEAWIVSRRRASPFAFPVVCEVLGLEPSAVRAAVRRLRGADETTRPVFKRARLNVRRPGRLTSSRSA